MECINRKTGYKLVKNCKQWKSVMEVAFVFIGVFRSITLFAFPDPIDRIIQVWNKTRGFLDRPGIEDAGIVF